ncbi:MAG: bifunctional hydroxymethylpyrimidine kinase/phosphomethylpyrimidine kinase, partial [Armatimonadota bacterium]|nr:bifunctional hydroxymethylpyrimidine kinase/phosphomethylpyrimidine kinase [Armatimonadota bacterium]
MTTVALTIAGSDPSGGAGIQADLRTFAALGVVGVSVITALTVQNSLGVQSVHPVPADVLAAQIDAVLSDTKVQAVKIGMLGGAAQVRAVAAALRKHSPPNVVLDPVLASTSGVPLLDDEGRAALLTELMPLCDLITPNVPELGALTQLVTTLEGDRRKAVSQLQLLGAKAVLVKGGHLPKSATDRLYLAGTYSRTLMGKRLETPHTHGTGCLLSSAIVAYLADSLPLEKATRKAKVMVIR